MGPAVADGTTVSMRNGIIATRRRSKQAGGTFVAVERQKKTSETSAEKWSVFFCFFFKNNFRRIGNISRPLAAVRTVPIRVKIELSIHIFIIL